MQGLRLREWHVITNEYPPRLGGVSDYTYLLASGLAAAGDLVHVWCPRSAGERPEASRVLVHPDLGDISLADLRRVGRMLDRFAAPRRLLVQWVPHGYGYRSMNLVFCLWLWYRATFALDRVEIAVHEPYLPFGNGSWRQDVAAAVHRVMTMVLLRAARRVWVSIPAWEGCWRPYAVGKSIPFCWLPVPSTIPLVDDAESVRVIRARCLGPGGLLIGHFGTSGGQIAEVLMALVPQLLGDHLDRVMLFLGRDSERLRQEMINRHPDLVNRVFASGVLAAADVSRHLSACDVMLQPYPDGVSSRRTSAMAALAHGLPIVTTSGRLTEPLWAESEAVALAPVGDIASFVKRVERLLAEPVERRRIAQAARVLYQERFDIKHSIAALRAAVA